MFQILTMTPTSPPLQPFSSSLGPDLATPTTFFRHIDPLRDTVEKTWPLRHVDRAKAGSDIIQEDRTTGTRHFGAYQVEDNLAKPDCVYRVPGMTQQPTKPTARNLSFTFLLSRPSEASSSSYLSRSSKIATFPTNFSEVSSSTSSSPSEISRFTSSSSEASSFTPSCSTEISTFSKLSQEVSSSIFPTNFSRISLFFP